MFLIRYIMCGGEFTNPAFQHGALEFWLDRGSQAWNAKIGACIFFCDYGGRHMIIRNYCYVGVQFGYPAGNAGALTRVLGDDFSYAAFIVGACIANCDYLWYMYNTNACFRVGGCVFDEDGSVGIFSLACHSADNYAAAWLLGACMHLTTKMHEKLNH